MNIRNAKNEDVPIIARLSGELGYSNDVEIAHKRFLKITSAPNHAIFVAEADSSKIAGWLHIMPRILLLSRPLAEIGGLIVAEDFRRKGVGQRLMKIGESWAKKHNFEGIIVRSDTKRPESHYFYPKVGYELLKDQKVYINFF